MRLRHFVTAMLGLAAFGLAPAAHAQQQATTLERVSGLVQPGIVFLETTYRGIVLGKVEEASSTCTGFFINPDGHFVTAGHCVDKADGREILIEQRVTPLLTKINGGIPPSPEQLDAAIRRARVRSAETPARTGPDREVTAAYGVDYGGLPAGRPLPARVLGLRSFTKGDVALGKLEVENVPVLELAPPDSVEVGTNVVSVGYPGSVDDVTDSSTFDPSFKEGSISSEKTIGDGLVSVWEISAAISPGMSGGPTVDLEGRVVGVNSFFPAEENQPFNFISPVPEVSRLLADEGVANRLGPTNVAYREGLRAFYAGDREEALAKFDEVLGQVQEYEFAQAFRARALRLPEEEDGGGLPAALLVGLIVLGLAAGAGVLIYLRRRGPREGKGTAAAGRASRSKPALVGTEGGLAGERIPITEEIVMGRDSGGLAIDDSEVSRRHASVKPIDGGLIVTDLDSANGTAVNGRPIDRPTLVTDGDVIALGDTSFRVELPGSRAADRTQLRSRVDLPRAAALIVNDGPSAGDRFPVEREALLGRAGADIVVQDPEASRQHARVRPMNGGLELTDLGSANGTIVNGQRIERPAQLVDGDVIKIGRTSLTTVIGDASTRTKAGAHRPEGGGR